MANEGGPTRGVGGAAQRDPDAPLVALLARHRSGDPAALNELMAALYPIVHRMVFRLAGVRGRDRQEDLVQSALEQVCRSLETFEGRSRVSTFVFGVCHRVVARANRYERVRRWFRREAEEVCVPLEPRSGATPEAELGRAQRLVAAELALAALDAEERAAFVLHELEEQSLDEVAEALGCSTRTVKRRLRSAREQLLGSGRAEA